MIELNNLSIGYGKRTVLDGISVNFDKGRLVSVIGVNGCGKSTLLKSIAGILPIQSGDVTIDGRQITSMKRNDIAQRISYLCQGRTVPDMSVEQLVLHGRFPYLSYPRRYSKKDKQIAENAMDAVGIKELAKSALDVISGGMRQSAYIAMALSQDTEYIFMDEPTTYLDISHQIKIMKLLRTLADSGKCIVSVMHDLPMAFEYSDEIVVLDKTLKIIKDSPQSLCGSSVIQEVFGVNLSSNNENGKYYYT